GMAKDSAPHPLPGVAGVDVGRHLTALPVRDEAERLGELASDQVRGMALLLPLGSEALHSSTICPAPCTHIGRATQFCDLPCPFLGSSHCSGTMWTASAPQAAPQPSKAGEEGPPAPRIKSSSRLRAPFPSRAGREGPNSADVLFR